MLVLVFAATKVGRGFGKPWRRLGSCPEGLRVWGKMRGYGHGKGRETGTADMACGENRGRIAAVDRLPEGVAVLGCVAGLWLVGKAAEQLPGNLNRGYGRRGKPRKDCRD